MSCFFSCQESALYCFFLVILTHLASDVSCLRRLLFRWILAFTSVSHCAEDGCMLMYYIFFLRQEIAFVLCVIPSTYNCRLMPLATPLTQCFSMMEFSNLKRYLSITLNALESQWNCAVGTYSELIVNILAKQIWGGVCSKITFVFSA